MADSFRDLADSLRDFEDELGEAVEDRVDSNTRLIYQKARGNIRSNDSVASRDLYRDLDFNSYGNAPSFYYGKVFTEKAYGWFVEFGTGGLQDPESPKNFDSPDVVTSTLVENIEEWIEDKHIIPDHYDSQRRLAGAIARRIVRFGTKPHPFLRPAWESSYVEDLDRTFRYDIEDLLDDL